MQKKIKPVNKKATKKNPYHGTKGDKTYLGLRSTGSSHRVATSIVKRKASEWDSARNYDPINGGSKTKVKSHLRKGRVVKSYMRKGRVVKSHVRKKVELGATYHHPKFGKATVISNKNGMLRLMNHDGGAGYLVAHESLNPLKGYKLVKPKRGNKK